MKHRTRQLFMGMCSRAGSQVLITLLLLAAFATVAFGATSDSLLHNSANTGTKYSSVYPNGWGIAGGKYGKFTCATCHNRNTTNIKRVATMINRSTTTPGLAVVFNNTTGFGDDSVARPAKGVCQVCHTQTSVHLASASNASNHQNANRTDCTQCHAHDKGFSATCNSCHGYPPTQATPGPNGLATPATGATGGVAGNHGVHDGLSMKCETCHNAYSGGTHMTDNLLQMGFAVNGTNVQTWGATPVTSGTFTGYPNANLSNSYTWQSPSLSAGTTVNKVAGQNTCAIYCHGDGWASVAGGAQSNGLVTTPDWTNNAATDSCDNCHGGSSARVPRPALTGAHTRHAGNGAGGLQVVCANCHGTTTAGGAHVDGKVTVNVSGLSETYSTSPAYNGAATYNSGNIVANQTYKACNNIYCHSNAQGTTGTGSPTAYVAVTWGGAALNCTNSCHAGTAATLATGSHVKHINDYSYQCADCHSAAGDETVKHADGNIDILMASGTYQRGAAKPAGSVAFGTCSNVSCHVSGTTPQWGSGAMNTNCSGCHGNATTTTTLSALHYKHVNNATFGGSFTCTDCHATVVSNPTTILDKSLHANGYHNYSGVKAGRAIVAVAGSVACSNFYCHSNGKGTSVNPSTWAVATPMGCDGCHGLSNGTGMPLAGVATNSHPKHAPLATDCYKCHAKTASTTAGQLAAGTVDHLDRTIDARLTKVSTLTNYSGAYNANKTCSATYCHGGAVTTPAWGTANSTGCNTCHKAKPLGGLSAAHAFHIISTAGSRVYTAAAANNTVAGGNYNFTCASCHGTTAHYNGPVTASSDATIFFGYSSVGRNPAYGSAVRTGATAADTQGFRWTAGTNGACNATYCHSNGRGGNGTLATINWASSATTTCNSCHGNATTTTTLSALHYKHVNNAAYGGNFGCIDCHATVVSNNSTIANKALHVNKMHNYSGALAGKVTVAQSGSVNCSNFYCHSNGKGTAVAPSTWATATAIGCDGCHGLSNGTGMPLAGVATNSHPKHAPLATDCYKCHAKTASTTAGQLVAGTVDHLDRTIDARLTKVSTLTNYSGAYNANKTCSATYCHGGAVTTPAWGTANSTGCNTCHKAKPLGGLSAAHAFHIISTAGSRVYTAAAANNTVAGGNYNFTCASCHGTTAHYSGPVTASSDATIFFGYSSVGRNPAYGSAVRTGATAADTQGFRWTAGTNGACNATYCHSNGRGGNGTLATINWASAATTTCASCHGNATTSTTLSPVHYKHVNNAAAGGGFGCVDCHAATVSNNTTISNKALHVNKMHNYSGLYAGKSFVAQTLAVNCSNMYCHTNGNNGAPRTAVPAWTSATTLGCSDCHGATSATLTTGSHVAHLLKGATCQSCHSGTADSNTTIGAGLNANHINRSKGVAAGGTFVVGGAVGFGGTTACSNITCHGGTGANATWGSTLNCSGCHPNPGSTHTPNVHALHIGTLLSGGTVKFYNYTANKSTSTAYQFGCASCHPMDEATYHMNGAVDLTLNKTNSGAGGLVGSLRAKNSATTDVAGAGNYSQTVDTNVTCSAAYCHSNGMTTATYATTINWYATTLATDKCQVCHGNSPGASGQIVGSAAHAAHVVGIHYNGIFSGKSGLLPQSATKGGAVNAAHGSDNRATTINCQRCHNSVVTTNANDYNTACVSCHGATIVKNPADLIANKTLHVNGFVNVALDSSRMVSKAQVRDTSFSNYTATNAASSTGGWKRYRGYKNYTSSYDYSTNTGTYSAGSCSNISCHNGISITWTTPNVTCNNCHTRL